MEVVPMRGLGRRRSVRSSPDRCQWQRDASCRQDVCANVRNVLSLDELDEREDCLQNVSRDANIEVSRTNVPGMNMVWNPPMKMICILPNCFMPSLRRSRSDQPNLAQKIALKKQMLTVRLMSFALASQVVLLQKASALLLHLTDTTDCAIRNPMAMIATNEEMARIDVFCHVCSVTLTT